MTTRRWLLGVALAAMLAIASLASAAPSRIGDLTRHGGETPRRLVGYGLVVGLDGTGDRGYGGTSAQTPTVRSIVNLLRRFNVEVPPERLRPRDVAAVLVTAEVSPYLRPGGRFEVQVGALGDATSLRGGVLWMTPLAGGPDQPAVGSAQGPLYVASDEDLPSYARRVNSGRIDEGGVLEAELPGASAPDSTLVLRRPDLVTAQRVAAAINAAFGADAARARDPGTVLLSPGTRAGSTLEFLAAVDTLVVAAAEPARVVIDSRSGTVVAGGDVRVGAVVVSHRGITLQIGGAAGKADTPGLVRMDPRAAVEDVAVGLHAAGARTDDMVAIFEALRAAGALHAELVVR